MTQEPWRSSQGADDPLGWTVRATMWRVMASILIPVVWLSATLLFYGFWDRGLSLFQNLVVGLVFVVTLLGALLAVWISYAFRMAHRWTAG